MLQSWQRLKAPSAQTYSEAAREVERFVAVVGNKPLHAITHADIEAYKAARVAGIKLATMNKNLTMLSALLGHAITTNLCPLLKNPFTGAKYASKAVNRDRVHRRDAYSSDQLNLLLHSPVYLDGYRPACGGGEAAYWLPLLGLMTGARLEDLCRIRPDDAFQREKVWCLRLHDSKRESRLGATAVMRDVPLHDGLLRAGFLDFVAQRRRLAPAERLFPELTRNARGKYGKRFGDWYGRYIDHIGLDDPSLDFHSLRHSFEAFCAESGLSAEDTDALLGHAPDADYGRNEDGEKRRPFSALVKAVRKLRFRGVAMAHLFAAAAQVR
ncbi:site-specific integrase [Cupriavidus basilensis]|uniref:site-specific integrase n=1 Tax=Cupriavidus basilensis TaxID=68895 RepID=UPI0023E8F888|nr:site-specific integrase [Cupriavidus basilensis]